MKTITTRPTNQAAAAVKNAVLSPLPWLVSRDAVPDAYIQSTIYANNGERVATVFASEANVSLLAAAPDLMDFAELFLNSTNLSVKQMEGIARAVLYKAKGG